jgi:hypothetical protein
MPPPAAERRLARRRLSIARGPLVLVAIALGLGLLIGRASVKTDDSAAPAATPTTAASTSAAATPFGPGALAVTGAQCSQQLGHKLVLGIEVRNVTANPVILKKLHVTLPKGGLTVKARGVGSCGELNVPRLPDYGLAPGGAVWLSVTTEPKPVCPAALALRMSINVTDTSGSKQTVDVGGFANLGDIPWSGCKTSSG